MKKFLKPVDLAREIGLSVQTVHNYEQLGFIPLAERNAKGYRLYTSQHLHAICVARILIKGYGWQGTRNIMQFVHQGDLASALAVIDAHHSKIHQDRQEVEKTLDVLRATSSTTVALDQASEKQRKSFRVGEVAQLVGVRVSAVRFWEEQGLLHPIRDRESRYRLYDDEQKRKLQIVVLLRKAGYDLDTIRVVLTQLATGTPEQVLAAAENRLKDLAEVSRRSAEATATLWTYIEEIGLSKDVGA